MNNPDITANKLQKEISIGIKLKKDVQQLIIELSADGYRDNEITDEYQRQVRNSGKFLRDLLAVLIVGFGIGYCEYLILSFYGWWWDAHCISYFWLRI